MNRSPQPPMPYLIACAIWFIHGFVPLLLQSYSLFNSQGPFDGRFILVHAVIIAIFAPFMIGPLFILFGFVEIRYFISGVGLFIAFAEFFVIMGAIMHGIRTEMIVLVASCISLSLAAFLAKNSHWQYKRWLVRRRRMSSA